MERYEKYKESGVEWMGEIPEKWEVGLLKRYCNVTDGSHFSPKAQLTGRPYVSVKDIGVNYINLDNCNKISEEDFVSLVNNGCSPKDGDVLLTKDGTIGRAAVVTEEYNQFVVLSSLGILSPRNKVYSNFLYLYLISGINIDQMYSTIHGSALTRLTIDKINNLILVCPPIPEQLAIANYLDRKTAETDQFIAQKERLLSLYEEEKTVIINQAVTQGINPDVKLKDSGIDWLGEIPEHWEVKKMKYLTTVLKDGTHGSFTRVFNGYRLLSVRNIKGNSFDFLDDDSKISKIDFLSITKPFKVSENDIQLAIVGATLGKVAIVPKLDEEFATQRSVATIRSNPNFMKTKFQFYFFKSEFFQSYLWLNAGFSAQPGVYLGTLENCHIATPNLIEQTAIVQHIETETTLINAKITKTKKIIALQKEYRTALISEAVTGKIKVAHLTIGESLTPVSGRLPLGSQSFE